MKREDILREIERWERVWRENFYSPKKTPYFVSLIALIGNISLRFYVDSILLLTIIAALTGLVIAVISFIGTEGVYLSVLRLRLLFSRSYQTSMQSADKRNKKINPFSLFCAAMLQKPEERDFALGCLEERFKKDCEAHGRRKAKYLFWRDLVMSIYPAISAKAAKLLKLAGVSYVIDRFLFK